MKVCPKCNLERSDFFKRNLSKDGLSLWCKECSGKYGAKYNKRVVNELKEEIFKKLGFACSRCGFTDKRALQIDHVRGDGFVNRRKISPIYYLKQVLADESGAYQILCANCNWIKRYENSEHVHRQI